MLRAALAFAALVAATTINSPARAEWPDKPVRVIVAYAAGGANDLLGRVFADQLGKTFSQQFFVENRTGGSGLIGTEAVARAAPDGYTLQISGMPSHVLAPPMNKWSIDPIRDFTHIAYLGGPPNVFVAHPSANVGSFKELLALMKSEAGGVQYVSPAIGSVGNTVAEYVADKEKVKLVHVVYRGGGAAIQDLVAGHVRVGSMTLATTRQHILAGKLKALAISSEKRVAEFGDVPTLVELGYPELVVTTWYSLSGPAGLPRDIVQKLNAAVNKAMDLPEVKKHLETEMVQTRAMTSRRDDRVHAARGHAMGADRAPHRRAEVMEVSMADRSNIEARIAYDDLREWLARAELLGEVRQVKGASWQEDIGLAAEAILREENGPCVVFDEVPGCPKGFRVLLNMFAGVRRNMTLGFPDHLTKWELSDAFREAYLKDNKPIPHEIVDDGPIFENIVTGDAIDVTKFPSPVWHELDGGRYIGTGTYSITRDPEEDWLNAGAYRAMVHDKTSVGMLMAAGHHAAIHYEKYLKRGEPMPVAMVLGGDPLCFFYGGLEAPYGVFEIDVVGGLARQGDADGEGQGHRPAVSRACRDRAGGLCLAGEARGRRPVRRMDRALCRRRQALHRAGHQGDLSSQRSDPAGRAADGRRAGRDGALSRGDAFGDHQAEHRQCRRAGGDAGVVPRDRRRAHVPRRRDQAALSGTRGAGRPYRGAMRRVGLCVEVRRGGGRRRRRDQPRSSALGDAHAHRPEGVDPVHRRLVGLARRPAPLARKARQGRHDTFGRDHRRVPAVVVARQVSADQHAERGSDEESARKIRVVVGWER